MYNILAALGIGVGICLSNSGGDARTAEIGIVVFAFVAHFILGPWLWVTEHRLWRSALGQASLPLIGIIAVLLAGLIRGIQRRRTSPSGRLRQEQQKQHQERGQQAASEAR